MKNRFRFRRKGYHSQRIVELKNNEYYCTKEAGGLDILLSNIEIVLYIEQQKRAALSLLIAVKTFSN